MIMKGVHLSSEGLIKIIKIAENMNVKKDRSELIRILREHTPKS